jgi:phytoene desaturase
LDVPAGEAALKKLFEELEPGSSKHLQQFLAEGKYKYEVGMNKLVYKPGLSISELIDPALISGLFKLHVFSSIASYIRKHFKNPKLIQLLEFPVLFLGAAPKNTPALYSLMNYADMALGTWYPMGGMYKIIESMTTLAKSVGVKIAFDSPVTSISVKDAKVNGITVGSDFHATDYIVAGADYHHVEQQLLPKKYRRYTPHYWDTRSLAPSSLIFYLGINKRLKNLLHHNLFFDQDFEKHAMEIYKSPKWPSNPLFYVSCPSQTDDTVAPEGHENIFILIPVAPGLEDTSAVREHFFNLVISRLETLTGQSIKDHIDYKRSYAHNDFVTDYHALKGNAYGLANTLRQTANLKPTILNKTLGNLFYTGQLTVPGPGVPPSLISGQVVAHELMRRH